MYPDKQQLDDLLKKANQLLPTAKFKLSLIGNRPCACSECECKRPIFALISDLKPNAVTTGTRKEIGIFIEGLDFGLGF